MLAHWFIPCHFEAYMIWVLTALAPLTAVFRSYLRCRR